MNWPLITRFRRKISCRYHLGFLELSFDLLFSSLAFSLYLLGSLDFLDYAELYSITRITSLIGHCRNYSLQT